MKSLMFVWLSTFAAIPAIAAAPPTPLFASDEPIRITIKGPMSALTSDRSDNPRNGILSLAGSPESYPIALSARGITRRQGDVCQFPPLRVDFAGKPSGLFAGQNRLKLVTHCRKSEDFQQKVLLEYAAYRLYNLLTPLSFRARLATIDYVDDSGKPFVTRTGFFLEDIDDVAKRNGMTKPRTPDRVPLAQIERRGGARFGLFNYMIGNLDWSMRAGPAGEGCCHNGRLLAASASSTLTPVPYDFDFSGLVDAPYATPPEGFRLGSVRQRLYRGYCVHNAEATAVASEMVARRAEMAATLASIPGLTEKTRAKAVAYLDGFFSDLNRGKVLDRCLK